MWKSVVGIFVGIAAMIWLLSVTIRDWKKRKVR